MPDSALQFARANREAHLAGLCDWLRIPGISTLPERAADVRRAHSPNEKLHLPNFYHGIETVIHSLDLFKDS
jgi:hypothetical protein